ncbi:uncharacterized protein LOC105176028 [Sesamum indicum]|uniref:Uncharacterized protein LOC105176028 n=1 Tax=Sesamum indicum TaxID=4182 RepID=A0A6I9UF77_SESIN|nr:uncharacterized protein LOC105176028 [Sesamum indicum]
MCITEEPKMIGEVVSVRELYSLLKKGAKMIVGEKQLDLDLVLVPLGMGTLLAYHFCLLYTIIRNPRRTVIGLNAESRRVWVFSLMADPLKNGVLAIQTIRNNIMASTLLATTAITLSSLISVYVSNRSSSTSLDMHGNRVSVLPSVKFFAILICFMVAFLCNLLSIRYYAHGSFLVTVPAFKDRKDAIEYVATNLNRGGFFWSLGLRAFYSAINICTGGIHDIDEPNINFKTTWVTSCFLEDVISGDGVMLNPTKVKAIRE